MRSFTLLSLCAAASGVNGETSIKNAQQATLSQEELSASSLARSLQEGAEGMFRATWGTDHQGSCVLAAVPVATMTCDNDAPITLLDQTA